MNLRTLFSVIVCCLSIAALGQAQQSFEGAVVQEVPEVAVVAAKAEQSVEDQILAALDEKTAFDFFEQPLTDVINFLQDMHSINAVLDVQGMDSAGVSPEDQLTCQISGVSLRSGLRIMLKQHDLTYVVRDETLQITSNEAAAETFKTQIYDVSGIVAKYEGDDPQKSFPELFKKIIDPPSWSTDAVTTGCDVVLLSFASETHLLVVNQNTQNHESVEQLIDELRERIK